MVTLYQLNVLYIAIVALFFVSCQSGGNNNKSDDLLTIPQISFDPRPSGELGEPVYEMTDLEFISLKLDTNDKRSFLPAIEGLFINDSYIYIVSKTENSIFIFDQKGNYVNTLQSQGKAPDEYFSITDVNLNRVDGTIDVLANNGTKLMHFDSLGNFLDYRNTVGSGFLSLRSLKDTYVFYKGLEIRDEDDVKQGKSFRLESYDRQLLSESKSSFLPFTFSGRKMPKGAVSLHNLYSLPGTKDTLVLFESISDTIYSISERSITPRYKLSYSGDGDKKSVIMSDDKLIDKSDAIRKEKLTYLINWLENDNYVFLQYSFHPKSDGKDSQRFVTAALFDKQVGKVTPFMNGYRFPVKVEEINFGFDFTFAPEFVDMRDGRFIGVIYPIHLTDKFVGGSLHRDAMRTLFNRHGLSDLDESSNPVLLFFNIRSIHAND